MSKKIQCILHETTCVLLDKPHTVINNSFKKMSISTCVVMNWVGLEWVGLE
jgi:hypothetical protein